MSAGSDVLFDGLEPRILLSGSFDFTLSYTGPTHVVQGHDMYVEVDCTSMGVTPADLVISLTATTPSPKITTAWLTGGGSPGSNVIWYGAGGGPFRQGTWLKISVAADAPLGAGIITVSGQDSALHIQHAVSPGISFVVDPVPTAPPAPVFNIAQQPIAPPPELAAQMPDPVATWKSAMIAGANRFAATDYVSTMAVATWANFNVWFYDGTRVLYNAAAYTGDSSYAGSDAAPISGAEGVNSLYRNWVNAQGGNYGSNGYCLFGDGLAMDSLLNSDPVAQAADKAALQLAVDHSGAGPANNATRMREVSYYLETLLAAKSVGCTVSDSVIKYYADNLLGMLDQDFITRRLNGNADGAIWNYIEPFMTGLAGEALVKYFKYTVSRGTPDYRIPGAIKTAADWLLGQTWNTQTQSYQYNAWDPSAGDFYYLVTYPDGNVDNIAASLRCHVNDSAGGLATDDQLLNSLYATMFGFLYQTYGEAGGSQYRVWGDKLFSYGILPDAAGNWWNGKQFSQTYRQSIEYVQNRLDIPWGLAGPAPVFSRFQEKRLTDTSNYITWTTSSPTSSQVQWGTSAGSLTNNLYNANNWLMTEHRQEIAGLTKGQTYYYHIIATDSNGQTTTSPTRSFVAGSSAAVVQVVATDNIATEDQSDNGVFTITRDSTSQAVTVSYTLGYQSGTQATQNNGADYQTLATSVTFNVGEATKTITVRPVHNTHADATRTVVLTLAEGNGYSIQQTPTKDGYGHVTALNSTATVILKDDETPIPTVTLAALDNRAFRTAIQAQHFGYDQRGVWRITRTGSTAQALPVIYSLCQTYLESPPVNGYDFDTLSGTATIPAGSTYVDVILMPHNNDLPTGYTLPALDLAMTPSITYIADPNATAVIYLDSSDFTVEVAATQQVNQPPGTHGTFTITRTAIPTYTTGLGDYSYPITVNYTIGGTAVYGVDYTGPTSGSITFPATSGTTPQSITIDVAPIYPNCINKTLTLTVTPSAGCLWAAHVPDPYVTGDMLSGSATMQLNAKEAGTDVAWVGDSLPAGTTADAGTDGWNWVTTAPSPHTGSSSHQSAIAAGMHYHAFSGAYANGSALNIYPGDWIYTYVYLDPAHMPSEIMLQFTDDRNPGYWDISEHRVYWGANDIALGTNGAASRYYAGALPAGGSWVRLAVQASKLGLEGQAITGVSFMTYDGRATFDDTGKSSAATNPALPSGLTATNAPGVGKVNLAWTNNAGSQVGTNIYRAVAQQTTSLVWTLVKTVAPGVSSFQDTGAGDYFTGVGGMIPQNEMAYYKVTAYDPATGAESGTPTTVSFSPMASVLTNSDTLWVDDTLPVGATAYGDTDGSWNWTSGGPPSPYTGALAHQSSIASGTHGHYFSGATNGLSIGAGDKLYTYVYLDPANMPSEVMLQFQDSGGSWEHRAYWGANSIALGTDGTNSRRYVGALPGGGAWVRLEVPAGQLGLEGLTITGVKYTLYNGRATWDSTGKTGAATTTIINAPSGLSASVVSQTALSLAWTDNATDEAGFKVYRSTDNVDFTLIQTIATPNTQSYDDTGLNAGTQYWYRVTAYGTGESAYSNTATASTQSAATPAAPSDLSATVVSCSQISLTWSDNSDNETAFKIDRATDSGFTQNLVTTSVGPNVTTYMAMGLSSSTTYYFRVRSTNLGADSLNTGPVSATTSSAAANGTVAIAVTNNSFNQGDGNFDGSGRDGAVGWTKTAVIPSWSDRQTAPTGLGQDGSAYWAITTSGYGSYNPGWYGASVSQTLTTAANVGTEYTLTVGVWNRIPSAVALDGDGHPVAPGHDEFNVTLMAGGNVIFSRDMTAPATSAMGFVDYAITTTATTAGALKIILNYTGNGTVAFDNVRLKASLPAPVAGLTATAVSQNQINLAWTDDPTYLAGFKVYKSTNGTDFSLLDTINTASAIGYTAGGLTAGTQYWFKVTAFNAVGESGLGNRASATTALPGDANFSGLVDQDDYKIWYDNYGTGTTWAQGNFKGYGVTDQDDYKVWYDNYGAGSTGGADVTMISQLAEGESSLVAEPAVSAQAAKIQPANLTIDAPSGDAPKTSSQPAVSPTLQTTPAQRQLQTSSLKRPVLSLGKHAAAIAGQSLMEPIDLVDVLDLTRQLRQT